MAVRAAGLVKVHGRGPDAVRALDHVDLDLHAGRFTAVMRPSGSGKSTLLQTLVGLLEPPGGTVTFAGREVDERRAQLQALQARSLELSGEEARRMLDGRGGARLRWDGTHLVGEVLPG